MPRTRHHTKFFVCNLERRQAEDTSEEAMSTSGGTHTTKTARTITVETTTETACEHRPARSPSRKRRNEAEGLKLIIAGELNPGVRVFCTPILNRADRRQGPAGRMDLACRPTQEQKERMTHVIRIDDEVYAELQKLAQPFVDTPNDVLHRLLTLNTPATGPTTAGITSTDSPAVSDTEHDRGALFDMVQAGTLSPGEKLLWDRPRRGEHHTATVTTGGRVRVDGNDAPPFKTPSGAAHSICGHEINGWRQWRRERDGVLLDELR